MRNNQTVKKAKTHCCPMCGSTEFSAHQVIHVDVMVDIETGFFNGNISGKRANSSRRRCHVDFQTADFKK